MSKYGNGKAVTNEDVLDSVSPVHDTNLGGNCTGSREDVVNFLHSSRYGTLIWICD